MVRFRPEDIRKKGRVPKNASLFFTIFQTFMSGPPKDGRPSPYFGEYPPDFFDFIVIDECHRGGANDGELGEQHLRDFQDNEKSVPTILTTSQKLSTGVDARNIRNIVLMRPIN